ncbi:MAG: hypothetical protein M3329_09365, partial [Pseudomonadota bacterium]|nr:hypothetical protein [Pseudomonadota bacterium]
SNHQFGRAVMEVESPTGVRPCSVAGTLSALQAFGATVVLGEIVLCRRAQTASLHPDAVKG